MHKDAGGKLVFGPVWDFDLSLGNANEGAEEFTDIFVGNGRGSGGSFGTWFEFHRGGFAEGGPPVPCVRGQGLSHLQCDYL